MAYNFLDVIIQFEELGVYDFIFPFLLIFCLIFVVLQSMKIFETSKPITIIVSFVIAFMALRVPFVSQFFAELFPRFAVGLTLIISLVLLVGLFVKDDTIQFWGYGLMALGFFVWVVISMDVFDQFGWTGGGGTWNDYAGIILLSILLIGIIIAVGASGSGKPPRAPKPGGTV